MRKGIGILMVCAILLSIGSTAQATRTWVSGNVGNWSNTANWSGGALPTSLETAQINNGTATVDSAQTVGILLMAAASTDVGVLNVNTGANLNVYKSGSTGIIEMVKGGTSAGGSATINVSNGTVRVGATGTANGGTSEFRLATSSTMLGTGTINLSGSGVIDTDVLSKGNTTNTNLTFNATGGTLIVRNMIYRFGKASASGGFNQGLATLEVGSVDTVSTMNIGNATNAMDYTVGSGGTINLDIASAASFDKLSQFVDNVGGTCYANTAGATLNIGLLSGYTPTAGSFFDVWTYNTTGVTGTVGKLVGSGAFASVTSGWTAGWYDASGDGLTDTLRVTYIPEPATMGLFGLGLLAIRRSKK
jgi:hypothetical protein